LTLTNAPATFQSIVNEVLMEHLDDFVTAYLDDVLIYSDSWENHVKQVRMMLQKLEKAGVRVKLEKCEFHKQEVGYLGYVFSPGQIEWIPPRSRQ
jgi:Reverse transcriptase (RNA-dependent DNA polymerase)